MASRAQKILDLLPQGTKIPELTRKQYCNLVPNSNILSQISQNDTTPNTDEVNNYPVNENVLVATSSDVIESETQVLEEMPTITTLKPVVDTFDIELMPMVLVDDYSQILDIGIDNVSLNLPEADEEIDCTVDDTMYLQPSTSADITYCGTDTIDDRPESPPISDRDVDYSPGSEHESGSDDSRNDAEMETNSTEEDVVSDVNGEEHDIMNADYQVNNDEAAWGDMNEGRKRKNIANRNEWKRVKNQELRMRGEDYVGFSRDKHKNFKHDVSRAARNIGEPCVSRMCLKSKRRFCNTFTEAIRKEIFEKFWKTMTWDQRKVFVSGHVNLQPPSRKTKENEDSRRENTMVYKLHNGKELVQVCRNTFLNTTGLGRFTVESWIKNSVYNMNDSKYELNKQRKKNNHRVNAFNESKSFVISFFDDLPKQPSHYVRKDTNKLFLEQQFTTLKQLYDFYKATCEENRNECVSVKTFKQMFREKNLSLFSPKKDRCDICIEYENKNIDETVWRKHIEDKEKARKEHKNDKEKAMKKECILLCMDLQAVKVAPSLNATKIYFKTKLGCHNFTIYNSASHQSTCYWFTEIDCGLQASTFVSCIIDYLERHCLGQNLPIIIYSDGCTFQNRNNILSNALLNFSIIHRISITQKYLTKGHTQMECDSVHSCIERKLKNRVIELPSDYVKASREARIKPEPYEVLQLDHSFFRDYSKAEFLRYSTMKPGRNNVVTDIKAIYYDFNGNGEIKVKLDFDEEFSNLPCRPKHIAPVLNYPRLYQDRLPITQKKWKHLQELKSVISQDCHPFYDQLQYTEEHTKINNENVRKINMKETASSSGSTVKPPKTKKCKK